MTRFGLKPLVLLMAGLALAGCGADGAPTKPVISANSTLGVNSKTGVYTSNSIGITIPLN